MKLTWRDTVSTGLVVAGLAMALSVVEGWDWPLLGGVRAGIVALTVAGLGACVLGGNLDRFYFTDPFGVITAAIAMIGLAVGIAGGLISGSTEYLAILAFVVVVLWALSTLRHAIDGRPSVPAKRALG